MRDPARIPIMLEKLRILWESSPDQRFGQLVWNIISYKIDGVAQGPIGDVLWWLEDNEMEDEIVRLIQDGWIKE